MIKLNSFFQPTPKTIELHSGHSLNPFFENSLGRLKDNLRDYYGFRSLRTFSFTPDGIFSLLSSLNGKVAVSVGESQYIIDGAKRFKESGGDVEFVGFDFSDDSKFDYLFISPVVVDTFEVRDLKGFSKTKIISNLSFSREKTQSDFVLLDSLKIAGIGNFGAILFNEAFEENTLLETDIIGLEILQRATQALEDLKETKDLLLKSFQDELGENLDFFLSPTLTHNNTLHIRLKGIKARELIRSLSLEDIVISNGERCSLGLSNPSRVIGEMGFSESESREAITLSFEERFSEEDVSKIVKTISKKFRQIKALS